MSRQPSTCESGQARMIAGLVLAFWAGVVLLGGYVYVDDAVRHYGPRLLAWWGAA